MKEPLDFAFELIGAVTALVGMILSFSFWDKIKEKFQQFKEKRAEKKANGEPEKGKLKFSVAAQNNNNFI